MNRIFLSRLAACRTRSSALGAPSRLGVRGAFCWRGFPLASPLPSTPSAAGCPALFGDFIGTTGLSDFPWSVHRRRASLDFPTRPAASICRGRPRDLPVLVQGVSVRARGL